MIPALYILAAVLVVGAVLYLHHRLTHRHQTDTPATDARSSEASDQSVVSDQSAPSDPSVAPDGAEACCGMHVTCERDSLLTAVGDDALYYDDEELDAFRGIEADDYPADAIDAFRDVLLTLRPDEIAPWARAIQRRGLILPTPVRDELMLIVAEARASLSHS